jgi:serine/threonine protein kinase
MMQPLTQRVGTVVRGKWTLERLLGAGAMAAVYVGVHRIGRRDALKILHPQAAQSKEICERFEREALAANRLKHPGAVQIHDIDITEEGLPFLVMELLAGETLAEREIRVGRIPLGDLLRYAEQILDTLQAAHAHGIIHRDVKPGNLYLTAEGSVKVLDFGLARVRDDSSLERERTRLGLVLGTTPYMAPEQARGSEIDARADLFGVGATLFRLIARRYIHEDTGGELLVKMATEPAPSLEAAAPGTPAAACRIVDRALAFRPDDRYPDARTMLEDVRAVLRGDPPPYASELAFAEDAAILSARHAAPPAASAAPPLAQPEVGSTIRIEWSRGEAPQPVEAAPPAPGEASAIPVEWSSGGAESSIPVEWSEGGAKGHEGTLISVREPPPDPRREK